MIYLIGNMKDDVNRFYKVVTDFGIGNGDCLIVGGEMSLNSVKEKSILEICAVKTLFIDMEKQEKNEEFVERDFLGGHVLYEKAYPTLLYPIEGEIYRIT